jgi:capsular exopolysaccharide synthesis family protein
MSRINEALRRAAEENDAMGTGAASAPATPALDDRDIATLAHEPFPVEIGAQRRPRPVAPEPPPTSRGPVVREVTTESRDSGAQEHSEPSNREGRRRSLFDRLDARLAEKVVADENISPVSREQYRRLAGVLLDAQSNSGTKVVMVASAVPGEGKTLTATNLALTLSESYRRRVLLIDADLRKPAVHQVFRLDAASGLIEGLDEGSKTRLVLRQVSTNLAVLPAGRPTSDPMAGLTSERMRQLLDEAKESFDWIIVDTPPLMLLPDAHLLSSLVDGAVLVVKARSTPHEMVRRTVDIIGKNRVLGVVLNQADAREQSSYGDYYGGYYLTERGDGKR